MSRKRKAPPCSHCGINSGDAHVLAEYIKDGEPYVEKLETGWCWRCFELANLSANLTMVGLLTYWRNQYLEGQKRFYG